jgi:Ring finger domain
MSNLNSNNLRLSNEHLQLINILNTMYNDNVRNINSINESIANFTDMLGILIDNNNQIKNTIIQLLTNNLNNNNTRRNISRRLENTINNTSTNTTNNNRNANLGNANLGNTQNNRIFHPYTIDSITEYTIPLNTNRRTSTTDIFSQIFQSFLQPVDVFPTQEQIEAATRRVRYGNILRPLNTSCPISMEEFSDNDNVIMIRYCGHIFNTENLTNWFRNNCRCPVCRYDIREYNVNISDQFFNNSITDVSNNITENST